MNVEVTQGTVPQGKDSAAVAESTDLITPARITKQPGKRIVDFVNAFAGELGTEAVAGLSFEQAFAQFKRGYALQDVIEHYNAFAGRVQPEEDLIEDLTTLALDVVEDLENYESSSVAVLPDGEKALSEFAAEVLSKVTGDPAQDVSFMKEAGTKAEEIAAEFFIKTRGDFKLDIAELSPVDIDKRTREVAEVAVRWFKAELAVQLHYQAARGTPEGQLKAEVTYDDFANSHEKASARATHFVKMEKLDEEQDEALYAKLRPALSALATHIRGDSKRIESDIPEPWKARISRQG